MLVEPSYEYEEFESILQTDAKLYRIPSIRILKVGDFGYIHGEKTLQVMLNLVNKGYWYFIDKQ